MEFYKRVEFSIENVWDICSIINSDLVGGKPTDEKSILNNIIRAGVLNSELGDKLKLMKGFRNIIVHRYGNIDDKIAFQVLKEHLIDFWDFYCQIEDFLEKK